MSPKGKGARTIGFFLTMIGASAFLDHLPASIAGVVTAAGLLLWWRGLTDLSARTV